MKKQFMLIALVAAVLCGCNDKNAPSATVSLLPGELSGEFSVSATTKVHFSKGNLQYYLGAPGEGEKWSFAVHQYDYLGYDANQKISSTPPCNIDLFGWGTGNAPRKVSLNTNDFTTYAEWGNNKISNGGNEPNMWRTLNESEWNYLLNRSNRTLRGSAKVNDVSGLILLPDNWDKEKSPKPFDPFATSAYLNDYDAGVWEQFETLGAVFLPAAGYRNGTQVLTTGSYGYYWSSDSNSGDSYCIVFTDGMAGVNHYESYLGFAIRLVKFIE